jgi:hypothetical protein
MADQPTNIFEDHSTRRPGQLLGRFVAEVPAS